MGTFYAVSRVVSVLASVFQSLSTLRSPIPEDLYVSSTSLHGVPTCSLITGILRLHKVRLIQCPYLHRIGATPVVLRCFPPSLATCDIRGPPSNAAPRQY